jgi:hypothetical protein
VKRRYLPRTLYPYAGTSGFSGTDTSRQRALDDDRSGRTRERHQLTMRWLLAAGADGYTWFELSETTGWHHGVASGALTRAHRIGDAARLAETRGKGKQSKVYVHRDYVNGRPTEPYRPKPRMQLLRDVRELLESGLIEEAKELLDEVLDPQLPIPINGAPRHGNQPKAIRTRRIIPRTTSHA